MLLLERERILDAWKAAGIGAGAEPEVRALLERFGKAEGDGWAALWREVRAKHGALVERLALPLWSSGDKVLRLKLVRTLDAGVKAERMLLRKLAGTTDPSRDLFELQALVETGDPELASHVASLRELPVTLREFAHRRLEAVAPQKRVEKVEGAAAAAEPPPKKRRARQTQRGRR